MFLHIRLSQQWFCFCWFCFIFAQPTTSLTILNSSFYNKVFLQCYKHFKILSMKLLYYSNRLELDPATVAVERRRIGRKRRQGNHAPPSQHVVTGRPINYFRRSRRLNNKFVCHIYIYITSSFYLQLPLRLTKLDYFSF